MLQTFDCYNNSSMIDALISSIICSCCISLYCLLGGETSHQNIVMRGIFSCFNTSSTVKCRRGDCVATLELNTRAGNIIWISYLLGSDTTQYSGQSQILTLYSGVVWDKKENKKILFLFLAQLSSPPQHQ